MECREREKVISSLFGLWYRQTERGRKDVTVFDIVNLALEPLGIDSLM